MSVPDHIFAAAAWVLRCDEIHIRAVAEVEASSHGAFLADGHPTCLFERHKFHKFTDGRFDNQAPDLSNRSPGGYGKASAQPDRLRRAMELDREAAIRSTSFGLFQIMGFNYRAAGYATVEDFYAAMLESVDEHFRAFVFFVMHDRTLWSSLQMGDWMTFKLRYNGPAENGYEVRIAKAAERLRSERG